jgi:hypothetical protein
MRKSLKVILALGVLCLFAAQHFSRTRAAGVAEQAAAQAGAQLSPQWRPTGDAGGLRYVGPDKCAACHDEQAKNYHANGMAHTLSAPAETEILSQHPLLTFKNGDYTYTIRRQGRQSFYQISNGQETVELPILWAFGHAKTGQTYALQYRGAYYESRVSYYPALKGLDITLGAPRDVPASLAAAVGQEMKPGEAFRCFNCHSTPVAGETKFAVERPSSGVGCEGCHGPGERHLAVVRAGKFERSASPTELGIFNPARLGADALSQQFCGACHRGVEEVMAMKESGGITNLRFQPYRIANSKCYQAADDPRISCVACHDPHGAVQTDAAFYDAKCLACHRAKSEARPAKLAAASPAAQGQRHAPACPTGKPNCVTCHMPKTELPGAHFKFSDHFIRVVKPGEAYPN